MITPAYFCIENFNGEAPLPPTPPQDEPPFIANPVGDIVFNEFPQTMEINLDGVASDPDNDDELIDYMLISNSNEEILTAEINNKTLVLTRVSNEQSSAKLILRATSNGLYVDFEVNVIINFVPDGIGENDNFVISIYPNPATDIIKVSVDTQSIASVQGIYIYTINGQLMKASTETEINVGELPKGVYFVSVLIENQKVVERIIIE